MGNWETAGRNEDRSAAQDTSGGEDKVNPSHLQTSADYEFYLFAVDVSRMSRIKI